MSKSKKHSGGKSHITQKAEAGLQNMLKSDPTPSAEKTEQAAPARQWNPPKQQVEAADESFHKRKVVSSANDCTGLMTHVPGTEAAAESLSDLYAIHELKPQGDVGKDNPNNDPGEVDFHE